MSAIESIQLNAPSLHERELTITVPREIVGLEFTNTLKSIQQKARHKGFRPGKMPKDMVLSFYGTELKEKLLKKLVENSFDHACQEKNLIPISRPDLAPLGSLEQDKAFTYRAIFQVKPTISSVVYQGLDVEIKKVSLSESDFEEEITDLQNSMATFMEPMGRTHILESDLVECESVVKIDGMAHANYSHKEYSVPLYSAQVPDNVKEALLGKQVQNVVSIAYTMPSDHQDQEIAGKACEMVLTIRSIKERSLPALDDEFAKDVSDKFTTLEQLRESIRLSLNLRKKRRDDYYRREAITKALVEKNPLEIPSALIERMSLSLINRELQALGNKSVADNLVKNHWQELWQSVQERAAMRVKSELLMEALINELLITVRDEEVDGLVKNHKDFSREDAVYSIQVEKLLLLIESKANITIIEEPLYKTGSN